MVALKQKIDRSVLRGIIVLAYAALSAYLLWRVNPSTAVVISVFDEQIAFVFLWVFSLFGVSFLLDKFLPRREVVWCAVSAGELAVYPDGPQMLRWQVPRAEVDEIRIIPKRLLVGIEIYVFFRSGRFKILRELQPSDANKFIEFIRGALPEVDVRGPQRLD